MESGKIIETISQSMYYVSTNIYPGVHHREETALMKMDNEFPNIEFGLNT